MNTLALKTPKVPAWMGKTQAFLKKHNMEFTVLFLMAFALFAFTGLAGASSDDTFTVWFNWIAEKLEGSGGMVLAILCLVGAAWAAVMGQLKNIGLLIIVILLCTLGVGVIRNLFTMGF